MAKLNLVLMGNTITESLVRAAMATLQDDEMALLEAAVQQGLTVAFTDEVNCDAAASFYLVYRDGEVIPRITFRVCAGQEAIRRGTAAHELKHFEQWQRGDLELPKQGNYRWKGVEYPVARSKMEYFNQPWEQEAYLVSAQYSNTLPAFKMLSYKLGFTLQDWCDRSFEFRLKRQA